MACVLLRFYEIYGVNDTNAWFDNHFFRNKRDSIVNTFQRRAHSITSADLGHGAGPRGLQELGRRQQTLIPAQARTQFVQPVFLKNNQITQLDFRVSAERSIAMSVSKSCASQ